jgi:hypothetical protein
MNHLPDMTSAVASAEQREQRSADVHECKHHEPSADMTSAVAKRRENSDLSDVHECKHSMNHLLMTSAVASAELENRICQMFMSANTHEPSADTTSAVASAEQRTAICQMFMSANTP